MNEPEDDVAPFALPPGLPVLDLGVAPYAPVQELQRTLRTATADGLIPGVVMLLEHLPVITLGNRRSPSDVVDPGLARARH